MFAIEKLEQNPNELGPIYSAKCFRYGTILPGRTGRVYMAIGNPTGSWMLLRDRDYGPEGEKYAKHMLMDLQDQYHGRIVSKPPENQSKIFKSWVFY